MNLTGETRNTRRIKCITVTAYTLNPTLLSLRSNPASSVNADDCLRQRTA